MTGTPRLTDLTHRDAAWSGLRVVVAGLGVSGFAVADALLERGAVVTVLDAGATPGERAVAQSEQARILEILGGDVRIGPQHVQGWPVDLHGQDAPDLAVTSPGWRPDHPVLTQAARHGVPVWGEIELAWRMRARTGAAPWLTVTGTNGKTTTVQMLAAMLNAAGLRALAVGNVGTPVLEAVLHPEPYDVLAVELSSFQLHYSHSPAPLASCCLNLAPDHVDWHGSMAQYAAAKAKVYAGTEVACIYNVQDPATEQMVRDADVLEGCRAVGFTLGTPALSMVGLVDGVLADRAFVADRQTSAAELGTVQDLPGGDEDAVPPHLVADALAAAALARAAGVVPSAVRQGLRDFRPDRHRTTVLGEHGGIRWVDDSKATNPHAARGALAAYDPIVWVAGGQLKGADVDDLVREAAPRLRGVVLLGQDRQAFVEALARHAPHLPVHEVSAPDTGAVLSPAACSTLMDDVVRAAGELAVPGDTVLLSPAAASLDQFPSYGVRGEMFAAAVSRAAGGERPW